ncbi:hypothetical protein BGZ76_008123, partial [Entomortierella beljakovae]
MGVEDLEMSRALAATQSGKNHSTYQHQKDQQKRWERSNFPGISTQCCDDTPVIVPRPVIDREMTPIDDGAPGSSTGGFVPKIRQLSPELDNDGIFPTPTTIRFGDFLSLEPVVTTSKKKKTCTPVVPDPVFIEKVEG